MAQTLFKNMTAAERRDARKQARLNKNKPPEPPAPIFGNTSRGRRAEAEQQKAELETNLTKRGAQPSPEQQAASAAASNSKFEDIFLSIIQFLPPDQQGRAFSLFSVFRQQPPEDQKAIVDSLMQVAREQTGPLFDLYKQRIEQDTEYNKASLNRQLNSATNNYNRLVQDVDTNALRDKAKTDRNMAKIIRTITNTAFVDRVAGSGIQRRRTQEQIDEARLAKEDIAVKANQTKGTAGQQLGQIEQDIQARLDREDVLKERDLTDEQQKQEEANRTLFLNLFENQFANAGDNARDNVESGDIDPTTGKPGSNVSITPGGVQSADIRTGDELRSDVFQSGGTDDQRRTRGREETRVKNATAEDKRLNDLLKQTDDAVNYYFGLNHYKQALMLANRDTSAVDAEMARLQPIVQQRLQGARRGEGSFRGASGSGIPDDLNWWLDRDRENYIFGNNLIGKYGTAPLDRTKLANELQLFSKQYADTTFGTQYNDLATQWADYGSVYIPGTNQLNNKYGSTAFNESLRGPVPVPTASNTNPRADVLSTATVAPIGGSQPVQLAPPVSSKSPLQAGWTDGLTNEQQVAVLGNLRKGVQPAANPAPTQTVINPNTGQAYTGAAAARLAARLNR